MDSMLLWDVVIEDIPCVREGMVRVRRSLPVSLRSDLSVIQNPSAFVWEVIACAFFILCLTSAPSSCPDFFRRVNIDPRCSALSSGFSGILWKSTVDLSLSSGNEERIPDFL